MRKIILLLFFLLAASCTQLKLARQAYDQNDYREAIKISKKILAADSINTNALEIMSNAYAHLSLLDSAIITAEYLLQLKPQNALYKSKLYNLYLVQGDRFLPDDPKAALPLFERAEALAPDPASAFEKKGDVFILQKRFDRAGVEFEKALGKSDVDSVRVQKNLAVVDSVFQLVDAGYHRGMELSSAHKYDAAKDEFAAALEIMPYNKKVKYQFYMAAGKRFYNKGSMNALWEAIDAFASASLLYPNRAEPHYFLGLAYNKKDKDEYVNTLDELQRAIDLQPDSEWAMAAQKEATRIKSRKMKMDAFWGK